MKRLLSVICALGISFGYSSSFELGDLRTGDLLFQTEGVSDFSQAISAATAKDTVSFVHVAIVNVGNDGNIEIIEASPQYGVRICSIDEFFKITKAQTDGPSYTVMRLDGDYPVAQAVERARTFIGQPYDWYYLPDNGKMYCSELVYEAFLNGEGEHIFNAVPMNFRAPDGSMPQFWTDLYNELGIDVPEGVPGTNPNDLSKDPRLVNLGILP